MAADTLVAELISLAAEQRGLVTSRQAREVASVTPQQLKRLTDSGVLERLHHGLYRLSRVPHDEHLEMRVAWLALNPGLVAWQRLEQDVPTGVLSHRTAAALHRLGDLDADVVELTATRRIRLSLPDITVHRGQLTRDDWQIVDELPVTTPTRTISDLAAAALDSGHLASIVRDALTRNLTTIEEVVAVLAPHAFGYGHRALDGHGFLDALIVQAGVPVNTLAMADIARRHSEAPAFESILRAAVAQLRKIDPDTSRSLRQAAESLSKIDPDILESYPRATQSEE
ncbi:type IV toxin-antitoxin system AbiEi family antitoxin domain-containing protein [Nocardia sp. R7R-8]|uniref:type IV toxin-antitoxin system AbiEi family antitoxin domain-containing protein n=1 Tax=Nocardia sp. R7R-8 TaxID=3459304 RepID=UPI00403DCA5C